MALQERTSIKALTQKPAADDALSPAYLSELSLEDPVLRREALKSLLRENRHGVGLLANFKPSRIQRGSCKRWVQVPSRFGLRAWRRADATGGKSKGHAEARNRKMCAELQAQSIHKKGDDSILCGPLLKGAADHPVDDSVAVKEREKADVEKDVFDDVSSTEEDEDCVMRVMRKAHKGGARKRRPPQKNKDALRKPQTPIKAKEGISKHQTPIKAKDTPRRRDLLAAALRPQNDTPRRRDLLAAALRPQNHAAWCTPPRRNPAAMASRMEATVKLSMSAEAVSESPPHIRRLAKAGDDSIDVVKTPIVL